jgi:hypothetical protein
MKEIKVSLHILIGLVFSLMCFLDTSLVFSIIFGILGILWLTRALIETISKDEKTD